jgi:hypothetical protein
LLGEGLMPVKDKRVRKWDWSGRVSEQQANWTKFWPTQWELVDSSYPSPHHEKMVSSQSLCSDRLLKALQLEAVTNYAFDKWVAISFVKDYFSQAASITTLPRNNISFTELECGMSHA